MTPPRSPKPPPFAAPVALHAASFEASPFSAGHVDDLAVAAQQVLARACHGALATLTSAGAPFGSILPIGMGASLGPIFALRTNEEHARNLRRDARASLLVVDPSFAGAPMSSVRVTLVGRARPVDEVEDAVVASLRAGPGDLLFRLASERMRVVTEGSSRWIVIH